MRLALREAERALEHDDVPVGCVITAGGEVVAAAPNERELRGDPTAHAEVLALREASAALGTWRLDDAVLYVTLEPCAMCAGAIVLARVPRVVWGAPDPKAGAAGSVLDVLGRAAPQPPARGGRRPAGRGVGGAAAGLLRGATLMAETHSYASRLRWTGSTGQGYEAYDRTHRVGLPPGDGELVLSSDQAFLGDPALSNPEQLLVVAASSCQLLMFLAIAARSRVDVVAYEDDAEAVMPEDQPMWITEIVLRPRIVVDAGTDLAKVERMVEKAHEGCYISKSLRSRIVVEAAIEHAPGS